MASMDLSPLHQLSAAAATLPVRATLAAPWTAADVPSVPEMAIEVEVKGEEKKKEAVVVPPVQPRELCPRGHSCRVFDREHLYQYHPAEAMMSEYRGDRMLLVACRFDLRRDMIFENGNWRVRPQIPSSDEVVMQYYATVSIRDGCRKSLGQGSFCVAGNWCDKCYKKGVKRYEKGVELGNKNLKQYEWKRSIADTDRSPFHRWYYTRPLPWEGVK